MTSSNETNPTSASPRGATIARAIYTHTADPPTSKPFTVQQPVQAATRAPSSSSSVSSSSQDADNVARKTEYLSQLRGSIAALQEEVNAHLTERMEEDKVRAAAVAVEEGANVGGDGRNGAKRKAVDEAKEEENYGEDVQDEEDTVGA